MKFRSYKDSKTSVILWRYDGWVEGKRKRKKGFSSKDAAANAAAKLRTNVVERKAGILPDTPIKITIKQVIDRRISQIDLVKDSRGKLSRARAKVNLRAFLDTLPPEITLVSELKTAHFSVYRDKRLASVSPQSVGRELNDIYACFNQARESFSDLDTWKPPQRPGLTLPEGDREVTYAPETIKRLLDYLRRPRDTEHERYKAGEPARAYRARLDAADYFQMALQSAKRAGEIRTRAWVDVLWHKNALRVDMTKGNKEGVIYLPESLMKMLAERKARQVPESRWIFPSDKRTDAPLAALNVKLIRRAALKLGIEWGYKTSRGVVFHTTRHTATTALFEAGHDSKTVMAQTGHSDSAVARRYSHPKTELRREAAKVLDNFGMSTLEASSTADNPHMPLKSHSSDKKKVSKKSRKR